MASKRELVEAHSYNRRRLVTAFLSGAPGGREVEPAKPGRARGHLELRNVEFQYVDGVKVLPGLQLDVPAGQTLALVGTTGAGKTTIAKLVARFYDPSTGAVELDGVDVRRLSDEQLRTAVAMVTQENFLFAGSVADNIALGRPDATRAQIRAAAVAVGADELEHLLEDRVEAVLVVGLDRRDRVVVERVEALGVLVRQAVLVLRRDPDDHAWPPGLCCGWSAAGAPSSRAGDGALP